MNADHDLQKVYLNVLELNEMALRLYNSSSDFPAINRNCKRILASAKMLMINLEDIGLD